MNDPTINRCYIEHMNIIKIILLFLLFSAFSVATPSAEANDRHPPQRRVQPQPDKTVVGAEFGRKNGEIGDAAVTSDRYDMLRMAMAIRIDPSDRTADGTVKMVFSSRVDGLVDIVFDLYERFDVTQVEHLSGTLLAVHGADTVSVTLPVPLALGQADSFVVSYNGNAISPVVNRGLMFKTHAPEAGTTPVPVVANMSQPGYAQSWWPCKDRPDDKFLMSLALTVPNPLLGISNGELLSVATENPGWTTYSWREKYPIASYLVSVAISDYALISEECSTSLGTDVPLRHWVFPAKVDAALVDFAPVCDMMEFCESWFGVYPFAGEKYGHAQFVWPGAMEHQTVTSIGGANITGSGLHDNLILHELAHQWFGDSLTPQSWSDIWLNEGFATYAEALWREDRDGPEAYTEFMDEARSESIWQRQGPVYDPVPVFPGRVIYDKGAWILHMLRQRMGDGAFESLVADWAQNDGRALGNVATQSFIDLASAYAGENLNNFFWPYLTATISPAIDFRYSLSDGDMGPNSKLTVTLRQLQTPLFDNTFPILVTTVMGETVLQLNLATAATQADFELPGAITDVQLDPEQAVLWKVATVVSASVGLTDAFPNPSAGNYIVFGYNLNTSSQLSLKIYDVMGREVVSRDLAPQDAGRYEWGWNVLGNGGERVPSGVYWAALFVNGERSVIKFSVVR